MRTIDGLIFIFFTLMTSTTWAVKALDFTIHQEYTSSRALGMGNAFTAVADDHSALFYNPAALAFRKDGQVRLFLRAGIDDKILDLQKDIDGATNDSMTDNEKVDAINALLQKNYGNHYYSRVPTLGSVWVRPNWGIAVLPVDLSIDVAARGGPGPALHLNAYADTTVAYGYARKFKWFGKSDFALGATLKAIHRVYASEIILASDLVTDTQLFDDSTADEGMTIDMDIGTMLTPNISKRGFFSFLRHVQPTFAVVVRNAFDYGFPIDLNLVNEQKGEEPTKLQRRFDFGSKWQIPKFWVFDPKLAIDIRDVGHENWSWQKGFHAGFEAYWKMFNWWKGYWSVGANQGYLTAGFGARMGWFQLDLTTFGEEVGTKDTKTESRRYMVELSLDF